MSDSSGELRQQLDVAADLRGVVRTMKAMAGSSIVRYEQAVQALAGYVQVVNLGLTAALREIEWLTFTERTPKSQHPGVNAIVFGSDQGLVGQFNDVIGEFASQELAKMPGSAAIWAVGERVHARLAAGASLKMKALLHVPSDVAGITAVVEQLQVQTEAPGLSQPLYVFHNRPRLGGAYDPVSRRLLPLDRTWLDARRCVRWPTKATPEVLAEADDMLRALVREHLFISIYQACAESLASENASRLAAMQRAEKNIDELTEELTRRFHRVRQTSIDEELFDVVSGFEALT